MALVIRKAEPWTTSTRSCPSGTAPGRRPTRAIAGADYVAAGPGQVVVAPRPPARRSGRAGLTVAELDGEVVRHGQRAGPRRTTCVLWRLYVLPEHQRPGHRVARCWQTVVEEARRPATPRSGCPTPRATPRPRDFYRAHGFRRGRPRGGLGRGAGPRSGCRAASRDGTRRRPPRRPTRAGDRAGRPRGSAVMTGRPDSAQRQAASSSTCASGCARSRRRSSPARPSTTSSRRSTASARSWSCSATRSAPSPSSTSPAPTARRRRRRMIERAAARAGPDAPGGSPRRTCTPSASGSPLVGRADRRREVPRRLRRGAPVHRDGRRALGRRAAGRG